MAQVNIPGVGLVQFADSLSDDEILTRARAMRDEASKPLFDPRDLSAGQLLKGGFSRGIEGLKGTALDLIPALGGALFGKDEYAKEQLQEYRDRMAAEEAINPTAYKGFKDIQGIGDFGGFVAETVGEVAPDIASFFLGAGAGTVAGKAIAKKSAAAALKEKLPEQVVKRQLAEEAATKLEQRVLKSAASQGASIGSTVGLFGTSMGQSIPETLNSIYEETQDLAPGLAITFGSLKGALDTYLPSKILKQLGPAGKDRVAAAMLEKSDLVPVNFKRAFIGELAKTTGGEAITEATQQAIDIVAAQVAGGTDPFFSPKNIDNILFAGLKGAVGGGTFGAPGAAMEASRAKSAAAAEINRRAQAGEITKEEQAVALEAAALQQVETDLNKVPQEVAPGITYDPSTGLYTQAPVVAEQQGREVNPVMNMPQPNPTLVGQGAPNIELNPAQAEMFGTAAFEQAQPTVDQALAGPPVAPAEFNTVLDANVLKGTGLKPQSGFYKKLLGKDMADPAQQQEVVQVLQEVRSNPNLSDSTKKATEIVAMQAFNALAQQAEMLGPRGGILQGVDNGKNQPRPSVSKADRESVQVPSEPVREEPTAGTGELGQEGVVPTGSVTSEPGDREAFQSGTLEEQINEAQAETIEPKLEAEVIEPAIQAPVAEQVAEEVAPAAPKATLSRQERGFLEDHVLNLKAERAFVKDPAARAAIDEEIANTEADLKAGKAQVGEGGTVFKGDVTKLAKDLRAALDKMGLASVGLKLEKALLTADGKSAQGVYANNLIRVALNAVDAIHTVHHEAIHAMREMGLFTPAEWNVLSSAARNTWLKKYDIESRYPGLSKEEQIEEAVAEAFADFQKLTPNVQSIIEKALTALRRIGNWLKGYDQDGVEQLFKDVASGELVRNRADVISKFNNYLASTNKDPKYQVVAAREVWNSVDRLIKTAPVGNTTQAAVAGAVERSGELVQTALLATMPLHILGDTADSAFPSSDVKSRGLGSDFNDAINQRSSYQDKLTKQVDGVGTKIKEAINVAPEQQVEFSDIANDSTVAQVDPTKPESAYKGKFDEDGNSKEAAWKDLNSRYIKLDPVWQKLYVTMRNAYAFTYEEIKSAINNRIDSTDLDPATKTKVKADIMKKLAEQGMIEPYFSLGREGDKWLAYDYKDKNGQVQRANQAFKSTFERKERMDELEKMGVKYETYSGIEKVNYRDAPSGSFINSVLNILETNKPKDDAAAKRFDTATDELMRLFIATLPETAFAKSFQKRKGTAGYEQDAIAVFETKMRSTVHQIANMRFNPKISGIVDAMEAYTNKISKGTSKGNIDEFGKVAKKDIPARDNELQVKYLEEFKKRRSYVLNPVKSEVGNILTSVAFVYTLGLNISSMVVNGANIPMIVMPYLKAHYPESQIFNAIGDATKLFLGSGTRIQAPIMGAKDETVETRVMPSIANYAPNSKLGKEYAVAVEVWKKYGQLNRSQLYEMMSGDTNTGILPKINAVTGFVMRHGERMNREITLLATYNLEMERLKKPTKEDIAKIDSIQEEMNAEKEDGAPNVTRAEATQAYAARQAVPVTELLNNGTAAAAAPRIAQSSFGKIIYMYKSYGISMYYMMFKAAKEAYKGETPEIRKAAFRQLGGIVGMSALMAGAQGIPMYGAVSLLYNLFTDDDEDDLDTVTQKALGDFLFKGSIEYFTNLAVASRMTLNDLIVRDLPKNSTATFTQQLLQAIGGPVIGVADRMERGYNKISEGHTMRGVEELLPSFAGNILKGIRYYTEGTTTLRGDPITGDVGLYNSVAQVLGFAPADYSRQLEINAREKGIDTLLSKKVTKLKQKYYMAKREGDFEGMEDFKEELLEVGKKHPILDINGGTINDILNRSIKAQERATKEMINGVRYNKKRIEDVKASMAEYGN
jgi:hypothetical protein